MIRRHYDGEYEGWVYAAVLEITRRIKDGRINERNWRNVAITFPLGGLYWRIIGGDS